MAEVKNYEFFKTISSVVGRPVATMFLMGSIVYFMMYALYSINAYNIQTALKSKCGDGMDFVIRVPCKRCAQVTGVVCSLIVAWFYLTIFASVLDKVATIEFLIFV